MCLAWRGRPWSVACGSLAAFRDSNWWSTISGPAWMGSLLWHAVCPRFVEASGHLRIGLCGLPSLPEFYLICINISSTLWEQIPFF